MRHSTLQDASASRQTTEGCPPIRRDLECTLARRFESLNPQDIYIKIALQSECIAECRPRRGGGGIKRGNLAMMYACNCLIQEYGTGLPRSKSAHLGPYSRTVPKVLWWSRRGGAVSYARGEFSAVGGEGDKCWGGWGEPFDRGPLYKQGNDRGPV